MLKEYLKNIADAIRLKLGGADKINAQDFADKVKDVYDKGAKDQQNVFWSEYTRWGGRTDYSSAFKGLWWSKKTFRPTYPIKPTNASSMFLSANNGGTNYTLDDMTLEDFIEQFGGSLDWSNCTNYNNCFSSCTWFYYLRELDLRKVTVQANTNSLFYYCHIRNIGVMKFAEDGSTPISNTMFGSYWYFGSEGTTHIEGTIGCSINLSSCASMTVGTMKQIITHLANYLGTAKEATCKITMPSARWEALEADTSPYEDGLTDDENLTWTEYVQNLGWLTA